MITSLAHIVEHLKFKLRLEDEGYLYIGHTSDNDWEYQPGIYTEKAFGRHIVCYDTEQKIYYCKIKRNED
jgi:hypothetical protein